MVHNIISTLAPFSRPHKPDALTADFLYRVYTHLMDAPRTMCTQAKRQAFERAADGAHSMVAGLHF